MSSDAPRPEDRDGPDPLGRALDIGIRLAAPALDLLLAVGDRVSRLVGPVDYEYYPVREGADIEPTDSRRKPDADPGESRPGDGRDRD